METRVLASLREFQWSNLHGLRHNIGHYALLTPGGYPTGHGACSNADSSLPGYA